MGIFPIDTERFIDLEGLTRLNAAPAEDTLIGIVSIEGIRHVHFVGFRLVWNLLMLDLQEARRVVHGAVSVVVVANRAVEQMIAENAVKCFSSCRVRTL